MSGEPVVSVTKETWDEAERTGRVRVVYWPRDPSVNLPQDQYALNGILFPSIGAAIAILMAVMPHGH